MSILRETVKSWLLRHDIILSRPPGQFNVPDIKLRKIRDRGLKIRTAVDGGAHEGGFTLLLKSLYPEARVVMVEPRDDAEKPLRELAERTPGVELAKTLLGPSEGTAEFNDFADQSSVLLNSKGNAFGRTVSRPMTTIDRLVEQIGMGPPDMIKLDLQGYELEALRGAVKSLAHTEAVMLEVSLHEFQKGQPLVADVMGFMGDAGFQLYDIFLLAHRPLDGALGQGDFLFIKRTSPLFADARWSASPAWA